MKLRWYMLLLAAGLSIPAIAFQPEIKGRVVNVIDGNTIEVLTEENETFKFRLAGVDCPELNQAFGIEAKKYLSKILSGKEAIFLVEGKDRLGNRMGSIQVIKGDDPRHELLARGLAWTNEKNANKEFEIIKEEAKSKGKGLWKQENPVPPWVFRRQQSLMAPKSG